MELVRFDPADYAVHDVSGEMAAITQIVVRPGRVSVELPGGISPGRSVVEAEAAELLGVALPVLGDLDVQVQVDPGAEERLDLLAGAGADLLEAGRPIAQGTRRARGTGEGR